MATRRNPSLTWASLGPFPVSHDWVLHLDTSDLAPPETADVIEAELKKRVGGQVRCPPDAVLADVR